MRLATNEKFKVNVVFNLRMEVNRPTLPNKEKESAIIIRW